MNVNIIKRYEIESLCRNPKKYLLEIRFGKLFYLARSSSSVATNSHIKSALDWQEENPPEVEFLVPEFMHDFLTCLTMHALFLRKRCTVKNCRNIDCQFQPMSYLKGGVI